MTEHTRLHLREAADQIEDLLSASAEPGEEEVLLSFAHLYHHLNTAFNGTEESDPWSEDEDDSFRLNHFPAKLPRVYGDWFQSQKSEKTT